MFLKLLDAAEVELKPVHVAAPLGNKAEAETIEPDYALMAVARATINVLKGRIAYDALPWALEKRRVVVNMAMMIVKFEALGIQVPIVAEQFMIDAFIDDVSTGLVQL